MKRNIGVLLLMMFLLIITSCGQMSPGQMDGFDGVIYNYENDLMINDINYEVYLPGNFKDNIFLICSITLGTLVTLFTYIWGFL